MFYFMEHISNEAVKPYIPFERRMLIDLVRRTIGQPVISVAITEGEPDGLDFSGINHGFADTNTRDIFVRSYNDVRSYDIHELAVIAGHEEVANYLQYRLAVWRENATEPSNLTEIVNLLSFAVRFELETEDVDIDTELEHVLGVFLKLEGADYEELVQMMEALRHSVLREAVDDLMSLEVKKVESMGQMQQHAAIKAYLEALVGDIADPSEMVEALQQLANSTTLDS